jgi:hypothetical protein
VRSLGGSGGDGAGNGVGGLPFFPDDMADSCHGRARLMRPDQFIVFAKKGREGIAIEQDDDWWKQRIAILWRAGVGVTLGKPKSMGENLSEKRAARLETARPKD